MIFNWELTKKVKKVLMDNNEILQIHLEEMDTEDLPDVGGAQGGASAGPQTPQPMTPGTPGKDIFLYILYI